MEILKKFFKVLENDEKTKLYVLIFLSLIGMILETIGIGIVMPLLLMFSQNSPLPEEVTHLIDFFGVSLDISGIIIGLLYFLVCFFLIKFFFLLYLSYKQSVFVNNLQARLSTLMFRGYLYSSYSFHLQHNTTELIRNVIGEVQQFTGAVLNLLIFITEIFVLIGIVLLLLFVEPLGAIISLLVLGSSGLAFDRFSKKHVKNWGFIRLEQDGIRLKNLNQGLNAVKEIKISEKEEVFISKYMHNSYKIANVEIKSNVLANTPRLGLELLAVFCVVILIFTLLKQGNSLVEVVPTIAVFGVAAFRIMPSINRLINTGQVVRYRLAAILTLEKELNNFKKYNNEKSKGLIKIDGIELNNVSYLYSGNNKFTLKNINLNVSQNEFIGIIGGSGQGKSTFLNLILGLLEPTHGSVSSNKINIHSHINNWQNIIGYVPQDVYLIDDTIKNNIAFGQNADEIDNNKLNNSIKNAALENFINELPSGVDTFVGEKGELISGGQKQRIGIARALYDKPQLLILDEATSALDIKTEKLIINNLKKLSFKPIILMVTHRENLLNICDYVLEFKETSIFKKFNKD